MTRPRRELQRGFTLVEMMVVVAIVATLSTLVVMGVSTRSYGANPEVVSDEINGTLMFARLRAVSSRRSHRVEITPNRIDVYQGNTTGMLAPTAFQYVRSLKIASQVSIWNTSTSIQVAPGASVTQNPALVASIDFRPDGSSTGGTIFVTDLGARKQYRVLVYKVTGSSYARQAW